MPQLVRVLRPGGRALIYDFPWAPFEKLNPTEDLTSHQHRKPVHPALRQANSHPLAKEAARSSPGTRLPI